MVKILQISDLHWRGLSRHDEYTRAIESLLKEARVLKPDLIVNCGDTFHTKTAGITPEVIRKLAWMFDELGKIAPSYTLLGNHDGSLNNSGRQTLIASVHGLLKNPNAILLDKSGVYKVNSPNEKIAICAFSVFDKGSWDSISKNIDPDYINIALYHGAIAGCQSDSDWRFERGEQNVAYFKPFDYTMLGDIHRNQFLDVRKDINGIEKPYIGYPGSLIQQNYGESSRKGYLVWDIRGKNDWDVEWRQLPNMSPFVTIPWVGSIKETLSAFKEKYHRFAFLPGTRYRITSKTLISQAETRDLVKELTEYDAAEVTFKSEDVSKMDSINAAGVQISKKGLTQDPDTMIHLYLDYISSNRESYEFSEQQLLDASALIHDYLHKLLKRPENISARNITWSIKEFKFDNLYGYGENNIIDFNKLQNIIGILGNNRAGKSSIIGGIMYVLFNSSDRGSIKNANIINNNKDYCHGSIRIAVGSSDYIIERRSERDKKDSDKAFTSVNLWKIRNDGCQEVKVSANGITKDETDEIIRKLIGTADDFLLTAFASQGDLNRFIENKATKRKEILNRFLELDVFDKLYAFAKEDFSKLNNVNETFNLEDWTSNIEKTRSDIKRIESTLEKTDEKLALLNEKRDSLNLWLRSHEKEAEAVEVDSFKGLEAHVTSLEGNIVNTQERLKNNRVKLKENTTRIKLIEKKLSKFDVASLKEDLGVMEELEKSISELRATFEAEKTELKTQENSIKKLSLIPCGDQFPECHFIKDGHKAKETIENQKGLVDTVERNFEACQESFKRYASQNIKEKIAENDSLALELTLKRAEVVTLESTIQHDDASVETFKKDLRTAQAKISQAKKSTDMVASEEFKKKQEQLDGTNGEISENSTGRNATLIDFGRKKETLQKLLIEQTKNVDLISRLKIVDSIQSAFSKNGIPAMILKTQLPAINSELAKILGPLVDFSVILETDTNSNIMDVYIEYEQKRRLVELGSGMEKTVCSLALRVALGNLSSLPRPDVFILDESFGALDEENLQKGMEFLTMFRGYFRSVFVITHTNSIKEFVDQIIDVKHNGIESSISV